MKSLSALHAYGNGLKDGGSIEDQRRIITRFAFHFILVEAGVVGMTDWLATYDDHASNHGKLVAMAMQDYPNVNFSFAMPPRQGFNEVPDFP